MKKIEIATIIGLLFFMTNSVDAQNCDGFWFDNYQSPGLGSIPRAIVYDNNRQITYVADAQDYGGDPRIQKLAAWDGENWTKIGDFTCVSCGNGTIECLELDNFGNLYIGGFFDGAADLNGNFVASKNIIKYSPSTQSFEALGQGIEGTRVYSMAWKNDSLFVGGDFSQARNVGQLIAVNNVALYDLNAGIWSAMGQGIGTFNLSTDDRGYVYELELAPNGELLVGGQFSKINGSDTVYSVARWSPNAGWSGLSNGIRQFVTTNSFPGKVSDIEIDPNSGEIYFAGTFGGFYATSGIGTGLAVLSSINAPTISYSSSLGRKSSGYWNTLAIYIDPVENDLYIGGDFNSEDTDPFYPVPGEYIAKWDLGTGMWSSLGRGITQASAGFEVNALGNFNRKVLIGGNFTRFDSMACRKLVSWDPLWTASSFGSPLDILGNGTLGFQSEIHCILPRMIGGRFSHLYGNKANGIYFQDANLNAKIGHLASAGFKPTLVRDLAQKARGRFTQTDSILVVGVFDSVGIDNKLGLNPVETASICLITSSPNGVSRSYGFERMASSIQGTGNFATATAAAWWRGQAVVGGDFTQVDGVSIAGLALKNGLGNWIQLANIQGGVVQDIFNDGDSLLYVGGTFTTINGIQMDGIAVYDGTNWSPLGQGFGFYHDVYVIRKDELTNEIVVGGTILQAYQANGNSINSAGIAFWDGNIWKTRGEVEARFVPGVSYSQTVRAIAFGKNGDMYIGGEFSGVDGVLTDRIAKYEVGVGWKAFNQGISGARGLIPARVNSLSFANDYLYVAGSFTRVGDRPASDWTIYYTALQNLKLINPAYDLSCENGQTTIQTNNNLLVNWSTGDVGVQAIADGNYLQNNKNENLKVWVYASKDFKTCLIKDSIEVPVLDMKQAIEARGHFQQGDSSYFWIVPGLPKDLVGYQANMISWNAPGRYALDFFEEKDTLAFQAPCKGSYEALFYSFMIGNAHCSSLDTIPFDATYSRSYNIAEEVFPWNCGTARAISYGDFSNYRWSTGSDSFMTYISQSYLNGQDRSWLYVEADTAWELFRTDTLFCRVKDSIELIVGKNINVPFEQFYGITQNFPYEVEFQKLFPHYVEWTNWDFGDGDTLAYYTDSSWAGELHSYKSAGNYDVRAIVFNYQCEFDTLYFQIEVEQLTSVESLEEGILSIFPNPSSTNIFLWNKTSTPMEGRIQVLSLEGKQLISSQAIIYPGQRRELPLSEFPTGMYQLVFQDRGGRLWRRKFVKN
ncbi:MAG: T9SS type A sorting domain-containing protein [Bacteroidia bacterium]|nr:T9SS type A sorting domain-containing protein [Bacteroidia bacterium]